MKRILLFAMALAVLVACDKNETGNNHPITKPTIIETQRVNLDGKCKNIIFDSAYVFSSESKLKEFCDLNNIGMPDFDFSQNTAIYVSGIAPAPAQNFKTTFTEQNGTYELFIEITVEPNDHTIPSKWDLMLSTSFAIADQIQCKVSYDQKFNPQQIPNVSYILSFDTPAKILPMNIKDMTYAIVIDSMNLDKIKTAINNDEKCIWVNSKPADRSQFIPLSLSGASNTNYSHCLVMILKDCDYDKVLKTVEANLLYVAPSAGTVNSPTGDFETYLCPGIRVNCLKDYDATLQSAMKTLGCGYKLYANNNNRSEWWFYAPPTAKINIIQLSNFLGNEGYLYNNPLQDVHITYNSALFNAATKEVY